MRCVVVQHESVVARVLSESSYLHVRVFEEVHEITKRHHSVVVRQIAYAPRRLRITISCSPFVAVFCCVCVRMCRNLIN